jgi:photosystem II cytochrome c550
MASSRQVATRLLGLGLLAVGVGTAFVVMSGKHASSESLEVGVTTTYGLPAADQMTAEATSSSWANTMRFLAGAALGAVLLATSALPAKADIEDVTIAADAKGKTTSLTKEGLIRGKRLFIAACSNCHVGGGTRNNPNVGLSIEELNGAVPPRSNIESMVEYLNSPTTYDGLKDLSETHPSIRGADIWPKMRSMKQQDLYDISAYILYMNQTIPEKWGGGKQYY